MSERLTEKALEAAAVSATVHVVLPPAARVVGVQVRLDSAAATPRLSDVLTEVPFNEAVICTVVAELTAEAETLNEALVEPAPTVTEEGTVR